MWVCVWIIAPDEKFRASLALFLVFKIWTLEIVGAQINVQKKKKKEGERTVFRRYIAFVCSLSIYIIWHTSLCIICYDNLGKNRNTGIMSFMFECEIQLRLNLTFFFYTCGYRSHVSEIEALSRMFGVTSLQWHIFFFNCISDPNNCYRKRDTFFFIVDR